MVQSILHGDCPGVYSFDEISAEEFGLEMFSRSFEVHLFLFFFYLCLFEGVLFQHIQVLAIFLLSKRSYSSLIWPFYSIRVFFFFVFSHFSLLTWQMFPCQIPFPYPAYIFFYCLYQCLEVFIFLHITGSLAKWLACSPMARETRVQSQVTSYQRLKRWYMIHPCITLGIMRYVSRVKWSNPGEKVAPSLTLRCKRGHFSIWKRSFRVDLDYGRQLYSFIIII